MALVNVLYAIGRTNLEYHLCLALKAISKRGASAVPADALPCDASPELLPLFLNLSSSSLLPKLCPGLVFKGGLVRYI